VACSSAGQVPVDDHDVAGVQVELGRGRGDDRRAGHPGHHRPARTAAEPVAGLAVLAAWAASALLAGGLLLRFRDA
jgi:hypothetical protein